MSLTHEQEIELKEFLAIADFSKGSLIVDLDGTVLNEFHGKHIISRTVGEGIRKVLNLGRPVVINSLRYPLMVTGSVGEEWLNISGEKIPVILMNGSLLGYIERVDGVVVFREMKAFPLRESEIDALYRLYAMLFDNNLRRLLLFFYPRDWKKGEIIWTPHHADIPRLKQKYIHSSEIFHSPLEELPKRMIAEEACMAFSLIEHTWDELQSYQHVYPAAFHTQEGVTKISGQKFMAEILGVSLPDSIGAGDTIMDNFLREVGLAVQVLPKSRIQEAEPDAPLPHEYPFPLPFVGVRRTMQVESPDDFGELICTLAHFEEEKRMSYRSKTSPSS